MHETCLNIVHDPGMTPGPELKWGALDQLMRAVVLSSLSSLEKIICMFNLLR